MSSYNIIIQPEAELDLDDAFYYLNNQLSGLGFELLTEIAELFQILEDNPFLFQKCFKRNSTS